MRVLMVLLTLLFSKAANCEVAELVGGAVLRIGENGVTKTDRIPIPMSPDVFLSNNVGNAYAYVHSVGRISAAASILSWRLSVNNIFGEADLTYYVHVSNGPASNPYRLNFLAHSYNTIDYDWRGVNAVMAIFEDETFNVGVALPGTFSFSNDIAIETKVHDFVSSNGRGVSVTDASFERFIERSKENVTALVDGLQPVSAGQNVYDYRSNILGEPGFGYLQTDYSGSVAVPLDASGQGYLKVDIGCTVLADSGGLWNGFVSATPTVDAICIMDPYFYTDPQYLAMNPNAQIEILGGIGNDPVNSVPESNVLFCVAAGLAAIGVTSRSGVGVGRIF